MHHSKLVKRMVTKGDDISNGNKEGKVTAYSEFVQSHVTKHCLKPKAFEHYH